MAFFAAAGGGNNPLYGRDPGPPPPHAAGAFGGQAQGGYPGAYMFPQQPNYQFPGAGAAGYQFPQYQQQYTYMAGAPAAQPQPPFQYVTGFGGGTRHPQPTPIINGNMPAANMTNSTGGVGCEPGYNYFFPAEHTKIHVLKSGATPPWQLPDNFRIPFHAAHVPVNTTLADLLKGFGATNPHRKKNTVTEAVQGGNGRWYKGVTFSGDQKDYMKQTLAEVGWDKTRTGLHGQAPVVYLYITKD